MAVNSNQVKQEKNKERDEMGRLLPGHTANPYGRPKKGFAMADVMRDMLNANPKLRETIMAKLLEGAAKGDLAFIREVLDRTDGKPNVTADIHNTGEVVVIPQEVYNKYGATQDTTDSGEQQEKV